MLIGETVYILIASFGESDDEDDIRVFANREDAAEAWHDALAEAMMYTEVEIDEFPVYTRGRVFVAPNGNSAAVTAVEVE